MPRNPSHRINSYPAIYYFLSGINRDDSSETVFRNLQLQNRITMCHSLILLFISMSCGKLYCTKWFLNQAFLFTETRQQ